MNLRQAAEMALEALEEINRRSVSREHAQQISENAITALRERLAQPEQEPVAWAPREDFYRELDRRVNLMRQQMEIKTVLMRCKNYDLALPIIDIYEGHVLVGQVTQSKREWVGMTEQDVHDAFEFTELVKQLSCDRERPEWCENFAAYIEAKLKEKNT